MKTKIYTRTGDKGYTSLYGGKRVRKNDPQVEAYGTIDELNSALGVAVSFLDSKSRFRDYLLDIQSDLLLIGSYLSGHKTSLNRLGDRVFEIEKFIDELDKELPILRNFILPFGEKETCLIHHARTIARRAERRVVDIGSKLDSSQVICYLNRLSDLLFTVARFINWQNKKKDIIWKK